MSGVLYEKRRIKRTVPMDVSGGVAGRWDLLYATKDGRQVYFDWDDDYLYFAHESAKPMDVRFDLDTRDDGWLRGADNLSVQVAAGTGNGLPRVSLQRFDTTQNRDRPVWAASPIPPSALKAVTGRTAQGTHAVIVAVPRTEQIGLKRKAGSSFGLRVDSGILPAPTAETATMSVRPMLRLTLTDSIEAQGGGLVMKINIAGSRQIVPGESVRLVLEAKNEGPLPVRLARLFLRGSQGTLNHLDAATFAGIVLEPGQKFKREVRSPVGPTAGMGAMVVSGGAEFEDGAAIAALASFDRVEPFAITLKTDKHPARAGSVGEKRSAVVAVRSRTHDRAKAQITLQLPAGWSLESGNPRREVSLSFPGDTKPIYFKVQVPASALAGDYPLEASVTVGGRTYTTTAAIKVVADSRTIPAE